MSIIAPSSQPKPRTLIPPWLQGKWGFLGIIFIIYTLLNLVWTYFHWGGPQRISLIANLLSFTPSLLASLLAWHVTAQKSLSTQLRRAWFILGMSFFMFLIGNLVWAYLELVLQVEPFPSIADIFYLAFYPLGLWGLLSLPGTPHNRRERLTLWLDLLSVLTVAAMFVGYFIIVPTAATSNDLLTQLIAPAYPFGSLLMIGGILAVLYRRPSPNTQSALILLLIGMFFFVGGDLAFGYTSLIGTYSPGNWTDASWNVAQLFFGLAALRKVYRDPASEGAPSLTTLRDRLIAWLPPVAVALGYALAVYVVIRNDSRATQWLMASALLLTLLVLTRQITSPAFADLPVRVKMILTFSLVSVLSVILVFATAYLTIRSNLESVVGDRLRADVEFRSKTLGNELSKQLDLMEGFVLGETIESGVSTDNDSYTGDRAAVEAQLQQQALAWNVAPDTDPFVQDVLKNTMAQELVDFYNNFPTHNNLLLTNKYGATIAATARPGSYSQAGEEWWQTAYNEGQGAVYISQPTFDPGTKSLDVVIAIPVHADHSQNVIGVLRTTYHFQNTLDILTLSDLQTKVGFDLLLPNGKLLNHQGTMKSLDSDTLTYLQASQDANYAELNLEGTLQLVSQAPVISPVPEDANLFKNLNWVVMVHEDHALAFAPLQTAGRTALLSTLFVLFLTAGVAVILTQLLVAPISRLTLVAGEIAAGNLSAKPQIEARDEIGLLASTFNTMLETISRTQKELQESETLYRSLVEYSPDMISVHSAGKLLFINPAGVKLLGAKNADELVGHSVLDIIPSDEREYVQHSIEQIQTGTGPTPLFHRKMYRIDGTSFEAEFRAIPISFRSGPAIQFVMRDITERKRLEEQWQKFKLGIEHSTDAVFMTDVDGTIRYVNPAFEKLYGFFWDEAVGQTPRILKSGKADQETYRHFWETLLAKGNTSGELVNRTKDGRLITIEGSATPILDHDGSLVGFLAVQRDVTERKKAEEKIHRLLSQLARQRGELEIRVAERTEELNSLNQVLKSELVERHRLVQSLSDSETRFRLLFESSPDAILLIDPNDSDISWPIIDCNEVACTMNGYTREELIGQSIDLINTTPGNSAEREAYLESLRNHGVLHRDGFHRHKDGHVFPTEVSSSLISFGGRELVLGIDRDITERKQAEKDLSQARDAAEAANRAKSEFLSRMSHELRTPMNAILGFAQLLDMSQKEPLTSSQKERVKQIEKGGQHLLDLINEILDISRIEANRLQISPEPVSIRESVQEVLDLTVPLAIKRHIQIVTRLGGMDVNPFVLADRQRLKQVLLNLLSNAVKYNYDGGSVIITSQLTPADKWRISVTDSGPGISQENLARLFVPFERLNDDQPNVEGTGLGLVLAKRLVELMHGQMGVESTLGAGSTFWLELPPTESPLKRAHLKGGTARLPAMSPTARRILYVEDNVANYELIQEVLADYSQIELFWAMDAKTGIETARQHHPNLILLDLHLGGMDGAEVLRQLKQDKKMAGVPVIVVSADATSGQVERLTSLGAEAYLTKPLNVKHFVRLIDELLGEKAI